MVPVVLVDEVMVRLDDGIEHHRILGDVQPLQQPLFDEEVEGVVDRGPGDPGKLLAHPLPDQVGRWMLVRLQDVVGNGHALCGGLNAGFFEELLRVHES